jgi:large conductance mechanosensitive channel
MLELPTQPQLGAAVHIHADDTRAGCRAASFGYPVGGLGACRDSDLQGGDKMLKEFQEFIAKGNVMDLAVGIIIGGAFGLIVSSLVADIVMPIVGAIFGGFDFSNYFIPLSSAVTADSLEEARKQGAVFAYGNFLTVLINFLILAWIIFLMVKAVNNLRKRLAREKPVEPAAPPPDLAILTEIRDILARRPA